MNIKKLLTISILIIAVMSSLTLVSADLLDIFGDPSDDAITNPISAPANAQTIKFDTIENNEVEIETGNGTHLNNAHSYQDNDEVTTYYSTKTNYDYIKFTGRATISTNDYPTENVSFKTAVEKFYSFCLKNKLPEIYLISNTEIDDTFSKYFTNPSNDTGGCYLVLYDKDNNTALVQNIVLADEDLYRGGMNMDKNTYGSIHEYTMAFSMMFDVTDNPELLKTVKKSDHADLHIILNNETGADNNCFDVVVPLKIEREFGI